MENGKYHFSTTASPAGLPPAEEQDTYPFSGLTDCVGVLCHSFLGHSGVSDSWLRRAACEALERFSVFLCNSVVAGRVWSPSYASREEVDSLGISLLPK